MPDRQRHGRLSDEPVSGDAGSGQRTPAAGPGGPFWSGDAAAETMELSRAAFEHYNLARSEPDGPDPMADTTLLSRVAEPRPGAEPADPDWGPDPDPDTGADAEAEPTRSRARARSRSAPSPSLFERHRRRFAMGAAGVVAVGALLALAPVRAELRDSFTRLPKPYTALYFTSPPQVDGTVLTVPVSVHAVDTGSGTGYSVRVWTVDALGRIDDSQTAGLKWDGQAMSAVVSMRVNPEAAFVWVSLTGSDQTLHYKIAVA